MFYTSPELRDESRYAGRRSHTTTFGLTIQGCFGLPFVFVVVPNSPFQILVALGTAQDIVILVAAVCPRRSGVLLDSQIARGAAIG